MSLSTDQRWGLFVGGILLGSTVAAAASTFLLYKYGPRLASSAGDQHNSKGGVKKRSNRASSPGPRHHHSRRSLMGNSNGDSISTPNPLRRMDTEDYYGTPSQIDNNGLNATASHIEPQRSRSLHSPTQLTPGNGVTAMASHPTPRPDGTKKQIFVPRSPSPLPPLRDIDGDYGTETEPQQQSLLRARDTHSESEAALHSRMGAREAAIYAGPADRANPAAHEAIRHVGSTRDFKLMSGTPTHAHSMASPLGHSFSPYGDPSPTVVHPNGHSPASTSTPGQGHHHHLATMTSPHYSLLQTPPTPGGGGGGPGGASSSIAGAAATAATGGGMHGSNAGSTNNVGHGTNQHQQPITTADALASEGRIIEDAALHEQYSKVTTPDIMITEETEEVCFLLQRALDLRQQWLFKPAVSPIEKAHIAEAKHVHDAIGDPFEWVPVEPVPYVAEMVDGVYHVWSDTSKTHEILAPPGSASQFFRDLLWVLKVSAAGHVRSFTHQRLQLLEQKFNLHVMLNADKEFLAQKSAPHRDFYNVRKVDTHVHHSACMHQKHLLRFIKSKLKKEPDEVVIFRDGKYLTLKEVFESLNLTPYQLSVDTLDVHADKNIFHRFDKFNLKYNPFGQSRLREVFIKQDNLIHGRFLAELTREVFNDLEASKYQHVEYRISVYGRKPVEWDMLAAWVVQNRLFSSNNMWMIQVPRLYNVYKEQGLIENFQQLLDNIFAPLFEVTLDPDSHPMLHLFLRHVTGFDLVDDESKPERRPVKQMPTPLEWDSKHNPAYAYYTYYVYANLFVLNKLREARGFNTFSLRPHSGEAGDLDHLATTFLLAENIAHGINLRRSPSLQYLYYMAQIGLCMSPLSNNSLFLDFHRNPFPQFFARGLSVSLSTDDPLQIHLTREPLVEEYSVAAQVWKLSSTDLCEIARNSVLHCGFPHACKLHWVGQYWKLGPEGNSIQKTNVPALRMCFRKDCYVEEASLLSVGSAGHAAKLKAKEAHNNAEN